MLQDPWTLVATVRFQCRNLIKQPLVVLYRVLHGDLTTIWGIQNQGLLDQVTTVMQTSARCPGW